MVVILIIIPVLLGFEEYTELNILFQNVTLNAESQAGQSSCRVPGRGLILSFLSQPGHSISTFTTFGVKANTPAHPLQVRSTGLSSVPATRIILQ